MTVKKNIPCSFYDIPSLESWLDEMALQGLFLKNFSRQFDWAVFEVGDPRPVRYRLDPVGKSAGRGREREEPYAEMGWTFVCQMGKSFYIFSCGDPDAPELYTDPQSLALAMEGLLRRQVVQNICFCAACLLVAALPLLLYPGRLFRNLLLWEEPQNLFFSAFFPVVLIVSLPFLALESKKLFDMRDTLAQGLPLKAKKRRNRPRFLTVYIFTYLVIFSVPRLILPDVRWQVYGLGEVELSHPWPTLAQLEEAGPRPLEVEPEVDGYVKVNSSWLVPVQEYASIDWQVETFHPETGGIATLHRPYSLWMGIQYDRARSPRAAEKAFQIELEDAAETLENWAKWTGHAYHIDGSTGLHPRDWPVLDRLEVAQYTQSGQDAWTFAALRGNDVLVVQYAGFARWEDCLPLFLAALDQ